MKPQQFSQRWWGWWQALAALFEGMCLNVIDKLRRRARR